jgi:hypothetical protein
MRIKPGQTRGFARDKTRTHRMQAKLTAGHLFCHGNLLCQRLRSAL